MTGTLAELAISFLIFFFLNKFKILFWGFGVLGFWGFGFSGHFRLLDVGCLVWFGFSGQQF